MSLSMLLFCYTAGTLGGIVVIAAFIEYRRKRFEPEPTEDRVFRCGQCRYVYTDDPDVDRSRCPQCGTFNDSFSF